MASRNVTIVVLWMAGALVSFSAIAVAVRELSGALSAFEMLAFRNAAGLGAILVSAVLFARVRASLSARRLGRHAQRNVVHFAGQYAWTVGVTLLPLAVVFAVEFTAPALTALLAVLLLGERLTRTRALAIGLGFLGVLVIVRPGAGEIGWPALYLLFAAFAFALTAIATKSLTRTETTASIMLWMNAMQLPLNLAGAGEGYLSRLAEAPALPLAALAICGFTAHWCLTNAYRNGDAIMVVPLDFLRIPLIAVVGLLLYAEPLDPFVFLGAGIIVVGILVNLRAETARAPRPRGA
ncbi:DMT family transporter [Salinarimonas chemoclinalis]|uniref:DMT family transporter n=1 Tax=Salinarimonas chemoclinalis TaxID=3241599 RepID=UPI003556501F